MLGVQRAGGRGLLAETGNVSKGEILSSLADGVVNLGFRPDLEFRTSRSY